MTAEDIVQEVMVKVWKREAEFGELDNQEAWCMTVTRNLALDVLRKKKMDIDDIDGYVGVMDKALNPEQSMVSSDIMSIIHDAINALPLNQKQVVHLREIEEYNYKDIAQITGMTEDQVKVYLHRARISLRQKLSKFYETNFQKG